MKTNIPLKIFFNGPTGAGKTTLANYFAKELKPAATINCDLLRHFIRGGLSQDANSQEFLEQRMLSLKNAKSLMLNFDESGYNSFISDLVIHQEVLDYYFNLFDDTLENYYHIVLMPDFESLIARDGGRDDYIRMGKEIVEKYYKKFLDLKIPKNWIVIDNSHETVEETFSTVLDCIRDKERRDINI